MSNLCKCGEVLMQDYDSCYQCYSTSKNKADKLYEKKIVKDVKILGTSTIEELINFNWPEIVDTRESKE